MDRIELGCCRNPDRGGRGGFVASITSALYGRTLDKGKTLLVQTSAGTVIEKTVQDGGIATAIQQAAEVDGSSVTGAEVIEPPDRRLHWKTIIATTVAVLLLSLGAITAYEVVADKTLGGASGTTIGDTFRGKSSSSSRRQREEQGRREGPAREGTGH
ncbi:hypothetical protein [Aeromicrobium sp. UC242_57]|uniref:hypothetical protein n=1 Tax=Aeromicrobium sp. UC242_57 TaxID=3374624 RepID=UPI00379B9BDD